MTPFDPQALPNTAAYVAALPDGLDAYPKCRVRTAVTRVVAQRFPQIFQHSGIDPLVARRLLDAIGGGEWMSDAQGVTVRLLVRDVVMKSEAEYDRWSFDIAGEIFARPVYRFLMYVVSPTLVALGATKRWAAFREGTFLTSRVEKKGGEIELRFPPHLYPELALRGFGEAFRASLAAARARNASVKLIETSAERGRWTMAWD